MKVFTSVMKVLAALAAIAGAVYVVAAYGDKIVSWAKELVYRYGRSDAQFFEPKDEEADAQAAEEILPQEPAVQTPADPTQAVEADFEN